MEKLFMELRENSALDLSTLEMAVSLLYDDAVAQGTKHVADSLGKWKVIIKEAIIDATFREKTEFKTRLERLAALEQGLASHEVDVESESIYRNNAVRVVIHDQIEP